VCLVLRRVCLPFHAVLCTYVFRSSSSARGCCHLCVGFPIECIMCMCVVWRSSGLCAFKFDPVCSRSQRACPSILLSANSAVPFRLTSSMPPRARSQWWAFVLAGLVRIRAAGSVPVSPSADSGTAQCSVSCDDVGRCMPVSNPAPYALIQAILGAFRATARACP
jgi:hypothetical protein